MSAPATIHGARPAVGPDVDRALLPTRANPRGTAPLTTLFDAPWHGDGAARGGLSGELARRYDGDLRIRLRDDRPTVVANFVETLDGVVAMDDEGRTGGGEVSGFSPTDRFVMGLLRALADVVIVGASTIRTSPRAAWTAAGIVPDAAAAWTALRTGLGLAPAPTTLIATSSGDLDPSLPAFGNAGVPIVIAAPGPAAERLERRRFPAHVTIEPLPGEGHATIPALIDVSRRLGARLVLSEAGPHLFGELARSGLVDELFLTIAPQLAGRDADHARLAVVEGAALWPGLPRWASLASVRRAGDHLFLRYQLEEQPR